MPPQPDAHAARSPCRPRSSATSPSLIEGVHEHGCGFEAQNEAWYRFLIQPDPFQTDQRQRQRRARVQGIDANIIKQRADFLRPDSLVAVIVVTDENEEADDPLSIRGQGWAFNKAKLPRLEERRRRARGYDRVPADRSEQPVDHGAEQPEVQVVRVHRSGDSELRHECPKDGTNGNAGFLDPANDSPNLRFFHQKERFGLFAGYPTSRYIRGLQKNTVPSVGLADMGDTITSTTATATTSATRTRRPTA